MRFITNILAGLLLLTASVANAGIILVDVEVVDGPKTGTFGQLSIDMDLNLITGIGVEEFDNTEFDFTFDIFGQTFTEANDIDFPNFPLISFDNGILVFIDFVISEDAMLGNNTNITDPAIFSIAGLGTATNVNYTPAVENGPAEKNLWLVETTLAQSIPEPNIFLLFALSIGMLLIGGRKKA